jgi:hypothetical protein
LGAETGEGLGQGAVVGVLGAGAHFLEELASLVVVAGLATLHEALGEEQGDL